MKTIAEVRQQFPQYSDLSDEKLVGALHGKYYADMPLEEFSAKVGLTKPVAKPEPSDVSVALNSASKGIASIPDALLNVPNRLLNLGKAAFGAGATALGRSDLAPNLTPDPDFTRRAVTAMGAIRPENEPVNDRQRIIDTIAQAGMGAAVSPANSVRQVASNVATGALGGAAAGVTKEATDSDAAAMLAGAIVPGAVQTAGRVGRDRVAEATLNRTRNTVRDETLNEGREAGYVISPSAVNPSATNKILESIAGKAATRQEASKRNQNVTMDEAARDLGYPAGTALTRDELNAFRARTSAPYQELAQLSGRADAALFQLREARQQANHYFRFYERSADPNALANARALETRAATLERVLEREATNAGRPELIQRMREARAQIAKSHDVERALNVGSGEVDARVVGRELDQGRPLSGRMENVGKFAEAFRPYVQEASSVPTPGVSKLGAYGGAVLGAQGAQAAGSSGLFAAGLPLVSGPVRSMLLSRAYQERMANPNYNQGRVLNQIPEQDPTMQALLIARAIADRQGEQR